jgi:hypothetical protein
MFEIKDVANKLVWEICETDKILMKSSIYINIDEIQFLIHKNKQNFNLEKIKVQGIMEIKEMIIEDVELYVAKWFAEFFNQKLNGVNDVNSIINANKFVKREDYE